MWELSKWPMAPHILMHILRLHPLFLKVISGLSLNRVLSRDSQWNLTWLIQFKRPWHREFSDHWRCCTGRQTSWMWISSTRDLTLHVSGIIPSIF
jgi:hypothetical protein